MIESRTVRRIAASVGAVVGTAAVVVGLAAGVVTLWPVACDSLPWCGMPTHEIITGESRQEIREKNAVRELRSLEGDAQLSKLPNGVYGYSVPWALGADSAPKPSQTGHIRLTKASFGTSVMEVHKASQGQAFVLLYVTESDLTRLESPMQEGVLRVNAFFVSHEEYNWPVGIPVSRLVEWDYRSSLELNHFVEFQIR